MQLPHNGHGAPEIRNLRPVVKRRFVKLRTMPAPKRMLRIPSGEQMSSTDLFNKSIIADFRKAFTIDD